LKSLALANTIKHFFIYFFFLVRQPLGGLDRLIFRGFTITLFRQTTFGRTSLDEGSARRRDPYLTTHITHNRQTSMPTAGFEPTIPVGERPQTHALSYSALNRATRMVVFFFWMLQPTFHYSYVSRYSIHHSHLSVSFFNPKEVGVRNNLIPVIRVYMY
jgi:hypothetical protein